ncbi:hypothetical protein B0O95_103181 [Mycetohabitans endofungorum]|uniref:Uncharacterized protein n=1 Tax=Mycetohabitans endofungorum TaxID=417203 RepID=A0A2P5KCQ3_9BURK|nr:hypothetical protein B0O95_103181 [Mycetohabitans endofungorum]
MTVRVDRVVLRGMLCFVYTFVAMKCVPGWARGCRQAVGPVC